MSYLEKLRDFAEKHWKLILFSSVLSISFSAFYLMAFPPSTERKKVKGPNENGALDSSASVEDVSDDEDKEKQVEDIANQLDSPPMLRDDQKFGKYVSTCWDLFDYYLM